MAERTEVVHTAATNDFACAISEDICGEPQRMECHTASDECQLNGDCDGPMPRCAFDPDVSAWRCTSFAICE